MNHSLDEIARRVAEELARRRLRLVLAESCTAGLISAMLARSPGISEWLCGSAVAYRNATKIAWLGVPAKVIEDPDSGAVSPQCAEAMARGALDRTPESRLSLSITGHLGPNAPDGLDGVVHIAIVHRSDDIHESDEIRQHRLLLLPHDGDPVESRRRRQSEAAAAGLDRLYQYLASLSPG